MEVLLPFPDAGTSAFLHTTCGHPVRGTVRTVCWSPDRV